MSLQASLSVALDIGEDDATRADALSTVLDAVASGAPVPSYSRSDRYALLLLSARVSRRLSDRTSRYLSTLRADDYAPRGSRS